MFHQSERVADIKQSGFMLSEVRDMSLFSCRRRAGLARDVNRFNMRFEDGYSTLFYGGGIGTAVAKVDPECDSSSAPTSPSADALVSTNRPGSCCPRSSSSPSVYYSSKCQNVSNSNRRDEAF